MATNKEGSGDKVVTSDFDARTSRNVPRQQNASPSLGSMLDADAKAQAQFRFRILVVDDEPSILEVTRVILESNGYEVLTAADGFDGCTHSLSPCLI